MSSQGLTAEYSLLVSLCELWLACSALQAQTPLQADWFHLASFRFSLNCFSWPQTNSGNLFYSSDFLFSGFNGLCWCALNIRNSWRNSVPLHCTPCTDSTYWTSKLHWTEVNWQNWLNSTQLNSTHTIAFQLDVLSNIAASFYKQTLSTLFMIKCVSVFQSDRIKGVLFQPDYRDQEVLWMWPLARVAMLLD